MVVWAFEKLRFHPHQLLLEAAFYWKLHFIGSCNTSRDLTQSFLQQGNQSLTTTDENLLEPIVLLPGEDEARVRLLKQLGDGCLPCNLTSASQREILSPVNCLILSSLKENASLRERARLNTVAAPHGGDWLRAIPNPRLGLTMSPHEFVLAARIWLGVPILPFPPKSLKCVCGTILDPYGDHFLSCGHGPLRTRRHDALCEIVYHALLTDNKYVKREQRCSGNVDNCPGDVFHPDFSEGQAGFFDVTVGNSLLPTFITKAAVNAGAAAEAAEASKDIRHEAHVVAAGGSFFPLVVETLTVI